MRKSPLVVGILAAAMVSTSAWAERYDDRHADRPRDYARVIDAVPVVQEFEVATPRRECWNEEVVGREHRSAHTGAAPVILGGIIGGVIGNRIGRGRGRDLATVAGTLIGASVIADAARADNRYGAYASTSERHCRVSHTYITERRTVGYDVTYQYAGATYTSRMDHRPGDRIAVEVDVRPAY